MSIRGLALRGLKWTAFTVFGTATISIITLLVVSRFISPNDFGLMAIAMVLIGFINAFTDVGISSAIIHRQDATKRELSSLYWLNVLAGSVFFVFLIIIVPLIVFFVDEPELAPVLYFLSLNVLIAPFGKQFSVLLRRELSFNVLAKIEITASITSSLLTISLAISGSGVWSLAWGAFASTAITTILLLRIGVRRFAPRFHFKYEDIKNYISFGLYQIGEHSVNYLGGRVDQLIMGSLLGVTSLGYYNFSYRLTNTLYQSINSIVNRVSFPILAKIQNEEVRIRNVYFDIVGSLVSVTAPILIGLMIVGNTAVPLIFGPKWEPSVIYLQILCVVALMRAHGRPVGSLLLAKGRADLGFKWNCVVLAILTPATAIGAISGGGIGVGIALLIALGALKIVAYFALIRPLVGPCGAIYICVSLKPIFSAVLMATSVKLAGLPFRSDLGNLVFQVFIGGGSYVFFLWLIDRKSFKNLLEMFFVALGGSREAEKQTST